MRAAIHQSRTGIDPTANARGLVAAIEEARSGGADMLFTPEMSGLLDRDRARAGSHLREEADDPVLVAVRDAAAKAGLWVHVGSLALKAGRADERLVNRGFLIDATGAIRARYDKIHLFDVDLPGGESWRESAAYAPGKRVVVAETPWGRLGLSICYDIRFPDLYRALSEAEADMIAVPAAFTVPTGRSHWHALLRARAIETEAYVFAAAQSGVHADGRATFGHSLVIDPWGEVVLDMEERIGVAFAPLDPARIADVRSRIPVHRHRRPVPAAEIAR
jgi:predicted amidohydrolase